MHQKRIALVAHDEMKKDMVEWVDFNKETLREFVLYSTKTTGTKIEEETGLKINKLKSGPQGGDQQIGSMISNKELDYLFFFWDALKPHPHDVDVKALLRVAVLYDVPVACNRNSADHIISSPLFKEESNQKKLSFEDDDENEAIAENKDIDNSPLKETIEA